ncbi:hypothetical protein SDC9_209057 [bioreactor metagenome]|uniref:Uncharacterized protein n=1 Tax=bioreactor metagenome TaxID=1076179 RepID=A0A645JCD4_9ZZZZ
MIVSLGVIFHQYLANYTNPWFKLPLVNLEVIKIPDDTKYIAFKVVRASPQHVLPALGSPFITECLRRAGMFFVRAYPV